MDRKRRHQQRQMDGEGNATVEDSTEAVESNLRKLELPVEDLLTEYGGIRAADLAAEEKLLASIAQQGLSTPILVVQEQSGLYQVLEGFRRLRALRQLEIRTVSALLWPGDAVDGLLVARKLQTSSRAGPLEEGFLIETLVERHGLSLGDIALRLCRSKSWVHRRLSLVRLLPGEVRERVLRGELTGYIATKYAVPLARANGGDLVAGYCESVIAHGLTTRQAGVVYQYLNQTANPKMQEEILARPDRVLRPLAPGGPPEALEPVRRLGRWCRFGVSVASSLRHLLEEGASEDVLERLSSTWQEHRSLIRSLVRELDEVADTQRQERLTDFETTDLKEVEIRDATQGTSRGRPGLEKA